MYVMSQKYPERSTTKRPSQLSESSKVALLSHCSPASLTSSTRVIRLREVNTLGRRTHTQEKDLHSGEELMLGRRRLTREENSHPGEEVTFRGRTHSQEGDSHPEMASRPGEELTPRRKTRGCAARELRAAASPLSSTYRVP